MFTTWVLLENGFGKHGEGIKHCIGALDQDQTDIHLRCIHHLFGGAYMLCCLITDIQNLRISTGSYHKSRSTLEHTYLGPTEAIRQPLA